MRTSLSLLLLFTLVGCGATASIEKSWVDKDVHTKDLQGVLVFTSATTEDGRRAFEQDFTEALQKHGIHAVASYTLKGGTDIDKSDVLDMAAKAEADRDDSGLGRYMYATDHTVVDTAPGVW